MDFIWFIISGGVSGFVSSKIFQGHGLGLFVNIIVGSVGGILGGWIFGLFGLK